MQKIYLIDTCVWRDYFEERISKIGNRLGDHASKLLLDILSKNDKVIYSDSLIWELKKDYTQDEITSMFSFLLAVGKIEKIEITKEEISQAKKLGDERDLPLVDCLNALQARNHDAILISQDKDFEKLLDICEFKRPQDIID